MFMTPFYTAKEASEHLRIHPITLLRHLKSGKVPGFKLGGQWRIQKEYVDKQLESWPK
jgi:excisionase family DNA binding protein